MSHPSGRKPGALAPLTLLAFLAALLVPGCLGDFAANQGRRQAARSSDFYIKKYAEPELSALYAEDPQARVEVLEVTREGRNWLADVVVHSGGQRSRQKVLLDQNGKILSRR
jgi:hypothetical protein